MSLSEDALPLGERASAVLSARYEQRLLAGCSSDAVARVVPAVVITGFLGSGKTTLVQHLLATAGRSLRIAVLVNEVAGVDIDSAAVNAKQRNAAVGVRAADLAGGCACCSVSGALEAALSALVASPAYHSLDYLLVETSGAADAGSLASVLARSGFALDLVVCVVDAEAGAEALREHPIARSQLAAADVVVLNKVDLAPMGTVCDLEDAVRQTAPGPRVLRCRFGAVAPEALLDANPPAAAAGGDGSGAGGEDAAAGPASVVGEVGFLSHEAPVAWGQARQKGPSQRAGSWRRLERQAPGSSGRTAEGSHSTHHHSSSHSSFQTEAVVLDSAPLCMACFQCWVVERLLPTAGLFRAKGTVWFAQTRRHRYAFHLSGRQRTECLQETTAWEEPPATRLAFIGQNRPALAAAAAALLNGCVAGSCGCSAVNGGSGGSGAAANEFRRLLQTHPRFREVRSSDAKAASGTGCSPTDSIASSSDGRVVEFSAEAAPLHGVYPEQVNAAVLRSANAAAAAAAAAVPAAAKGLGGNGLQPSSPADLSSRARFLCGVAGAALLSAATGLASSERPVVALQAAFRPQEGAEVGAATWGVLVADAAAGAVLRRAYAHVTSCKCDVVAAMVAQSEGAAGSGGAG